MDVLSEVLRVVKLEGAVFFNAEFPLPGVLAPPHHPPSHLPLHLEGDT